MKWRWNPEAQLWGRCIPEPNTGCWLWLGTGDGRYGRIRRNGRSVPTHRVSWEEMNGPVPAGMVVMHRCDTPACINPLHLSVGSPAENRHDMIRKGRQARGEKNGFSKLATEDVLEIRRMYAAGEASQNKLAAKFTVTQQTIWKVIHRKTWPHLEGK